MLLSSSKRRPCMLLLFIVGLCVADRTDRDLLSARCRAKCLSLLKLRRGGVVEVKAQNGDVDGNDLLGCNTDDTCSQCMTPCGERFAGVEQCKRGCKDNSFPCIESCEFLKLSVTFKAGGCPHPSQMRGFEAACTVECNNDGQCNGEHKCCENSCGKMCVKPIPRKNGLPDVPSGLDIKSVNKRVQLSWQHASNDTVVYVIQGRTSKKRNLLRNNEQWRLLTQTVSSPVLFSGLQHGLFFQFRVAAVNTRGSQHFSSPSQVFIRAPERPSAPLSLVVRKEQRRNKSVEVTVSWEPPVYSPMGVSRYKIFWSARLQGVSSQLVSLTEHSATVGGTEQSCTIPDLQYGTTYFVQVQAIVKSGNMRAKSARTSVYFKTFLLATEKQQEKFTPTESYRPNDRPMADIQVGEPYYHMGDLKADIVLGRTSGDVEKYIVRWECLEDKKSSHGAKHTKSATTHLTNFTLYGLQYNCQHSVSVSAVHKGGGLGDTSLRYFPTPLCRDVIVKGYTPPSCDYEVKKAKIPRMPVNAKYTVLHLSARNSSVEVSWSLDPSDLATREVHIIWGESILEREGKLAIIEETAARKVLAKGTTKAVITGLKANKIYLVHLQAASADALSHPTAFMIPVNTDLPKAPDKKFRTKPATTKTDKAASSNQHNSASRSFSTLLPIILLSMYL